MLILVISEVPLNTKVKDLGGGERVISSELVRQSSLLMFSDFNVSIYPGVVILSIPKVLPIPEISTDFDLSWFSSSIEPITLYVEVSAVLIFDIIISSIDSSVIVLILTFPLVNPVIDGLLVIPSIFNVGVSVVSLES